MSNIEPISFSEFLESGTLYKAYLIRENNLIVSPGTNHHANWPPINLPCICIKSSTTWSGKSYNIYNGDPALSINKEFSFHSTVHYRCQVCQRNREFFVRLVGKYPVREGDHPIVKATKLGQWPKLEITLSKVMEDGLDADEREQYIKSVLSYNHAHGAAALLYLRRIVEQRVNRLVDEAIKVDGGRKTEFDAARGKKSFVNIVDTLGKYASLPKTTGGHSPLELIYDKAGDGIHGMTDEECCDVYKSLQHVFIRMVEKEDEDRKDREFNSVVAKLTKK